MLYESSYWACVMLVDDSESRCLHRVNVGILFCSRLHCVYKDYDDPNSFYCLLAASKADLQWQSVVRPSVYPGSISLCWTSIRIS